MQDVVKIESEFIKNIISNLVSRVLKNKKDYDVQFQLNELHAENTDGDIYVHIDMNAKIENEDLIKNIIPNYIKPFMWGDYKIRKALAQCAVNQYLKGKNYKIEVELSKLECRKESKINIYVNGNAYMSEVELQRILKEKNVL